MVPHLVTALTGPINELEQRVLDSMPAIERWFRLEWMEHTPPFYSSVDIRNAGFKLAPVDTNLYPGRLEQPHARDAAAGGAGRAGRDREDLPRGAQPAGDPREPSHATPSTWPTWPSWCASSTWPGSTCASARSIRRSSRPRRSSCPTASTVCLEPVVRGKRRLGLKHFDPCTILLNNDLSAGTPGILEDLHEQYLLPPLHAGWSVRRKSNHFHSYEEVSKRFGKLLGIDPWLINPMYAKAGERRFRQRRRAGRADQPCGRAAHQDPPQVQGIRHQREALRGREVRQRQPTAWA